MGSDDLDVATLAHYRRVLERAAAGDPSAAGATAAVFAALDRRDGREREMRNLVAQIAALEPDVRTDAALRSVLECPICKSELSAALLHPAHCPVTRARALLAR